MELLNAKVFVAENRLDHEQVAYGISNRQISHPQQSHEPLGCWIILLPLQQFVKFVPLDLNCAMTIGLVVCADDILRSDRVSVFNACGNEDMFDDVGV